MARLTSGAFGARTRLSAKALRLYAEQGILVPVEVDPVNRYRLYDEDQTADARLILLLRGIDMPLARIRELLGTPPESRAEAVAAYWREREAERASQRHLAAYVVSVVSAEKESIMTVQTRETAEQTYLTELRRVTPQEIPGFIQSSADRLGAIAARFGGWAGPLTTIYESAVNDDTDGNVRNAVPVRTGVRADDVSAPAEVLVEPGGEEAYTRITKSQVQYPQILQAYDEVYDWLDAQGLTPRLSPREIYFADWDSAGPDDEVCDVAVPFTL
jgi:DNA-binding transcriptional MerR regulator